MNEHLARETSQRLRILAEPTRLRILHRLFEGEATVSELSAWLAMPLVHVSYHLSALRHAAFVEFRRDGRRAYYRLRPDAVQPHRKLTFTNCVLDLEAF